MPDACATRRDYSFCEGIAVEIEAVLVLSLFERGVIFIFSA